MFLHTLREFFSLFFKLTRVNFQIMYGAWRVARLPKPIVTIFGSARIDLENLYAQQAHQLAQMLVEQDLSVLTGGGSGIMQAASCGAIPIKGKGRSLGIGVKELHEKPNPCVHEYFELDYFYARKWLLTEYSVGFVVFPGGFGTLDELAQVLVLVQTHKLKRVPIILIGKEYWEPFLGWLTNEVLKHKFIENDSLDLFIVTDDVQRALSLVCEKCKIPGKPASEGK